MDIEILNFQGDFLCLDWGKLRENRKQLCRDTAGTGGVADSAEGYHARLGGGSSKGCRVSLSGGEAHGGRGGHADAQKCPGALIFKFILLWTQPLRQGEHHTLHKSNEPRA